MPDLETEEEAVKRIALNIQEKEYNKLLLKYSEINRELNKTKNELYRARNDINEQNKFKT